jgi:hypothetical protein
MKEDNFFKSKTSPEKEDFSTLTDEEIITKIENQDNLNNAFALYLINNNKIDYLVNNIKNFNNLNQETALKLIEASEGSLVASNLEKFEGLNQEIAEKLINIGGNRERKRVGYRLSFL